MHPEPWFDASGPGMALMPIVGLILVALWIWILVDCARRSFRNGLEKAIWIAALAVFPFAAAVVYLIAIKFNNPMGLLNTDFRGPSPKPIPRSNPQTATENSASETPPTPPSHN